MPKMQAPFSGRIMFRSLKEILHNWILGHLTTFIFTMLFTKIFHGTEKIDNSIDYSVELYTYYNHYLYKQLELKPRRHQACYFSQSGI